jgi:hypothetical protein
MNRLRTRQGLPLPAHAEQDRPMTEISRVLHEPSLRRRVLQIADITAKSWGLDSQTASAQQTAACTEKVPEQGCMAYQKSALKFVMLKQQGVPERRFPDTRCGVALAALEARVLGKAGNQSRRERGDRSRFASFAQIGWAI